MRACDFGSKICGCPTCIGRRLKFDGYSDIAQNKAFKQATPQDKLLFFGVKDLKKLAKNKKIKKYYKMNKTQLLEALEKEITNEDFNGFLPKPVEPLIIY